jgi:hypothetical protein
LSPYLGFRISGPSSSFSASSWWNWNK